MSDREIVTSRLVGVARGQVLEVAAPERIVFQHESRPRFEMTISLAAEATGTRITWRMRFESAAECDRVKRIAVDANEQNLDRLEAELARTSA